MVANRPVNRNAIPGPSKPNGGYICNCVGSSRWNIPWIAATKTFIKPGRQSMVMIRASGLNMPMLQSRSGAISGCRAAFFSHEFGSLGSPDVLVVPDQWIELYAISAMPKVMWLSGESFRCISGIPEPALVINNLLPRG